jgi:hypothetical protein
MRSDDEIEYIATRVGIENLTKPEVVRLQKIELDRAANMYRYMKTGSLEPTPGELRRSGFKHGGKVCRGRKAARSAETQAR